MKAAVQEKIDTNPDMWTAKDVGNFLKISSKNVYVQARAGNIPCKIIGKTFRFSREKIVSLV